MKFYRDLYLSDGLEKKREVIMKKLKAGKFHRGYQLIVLSANPKNHLEIFSSMLLLQSAFTKNGLFVIGITKDYEEALEFVEHLVEKVYNETGRTDIRSYIIEKEQEG
ncbi:MAG: hypothetical protein ACI4UH_02805 [Dorea sp.]